MHFISALQTPITYLFVNENIKCGYTFLSYNVTNILVPKLFGIAKNFDFAFTAPSSSVGETLHVAYKKNKIKKKYFFCKY